MKVAIIAGGKGTRLGRTDVPKPMVPVAGKPLLEHQILLARRYGLTDITILSGHLAQVIVDYFGDGSRWGVNLTHVVEPFPLGTAGSLKLLEGTHRERFVVLYGDVVLDMDLERFIRFDARCNALATLAVHPNDHPGDSDLVEADPAGRVTAFHSKPHTAGACHANLVNAAAYVVSPAIFNYIPSDRSTDFGKHIFPEALAAGAQLAAYRTREYIKDMGTPDRLAEVSHDVESGRVARFNIAHPRSAVFLDRDGVVAEFVDNLTRPEELQLTPGAGAALRAINRSEFAAVLVTNQPMLAKGFMTAGDLQQVHNRLENLLGSEHAFLDAIYHCPHHPEFGFEGEVRALKRECDCRKPGWGMLLQASRDLNLSLGTSWMIGDQESDILAGHRAGCQTIQIAAPSRASRFADHVASSLQEAVQFLVPQRQQRIAA